MKIEDYFYTESQAAQALGINRITIWRWIKTGKIHVQRVGKIGFIPRDEVELIKKRRKAKCTIMTS